MPLFFMCDVLGRYVPRVWFQAPKSTIILHLFVPSNNLLVFVDRSQFLVGSPAILRHILSYFINSLAKPHSSCRIVSLQVLARVHTGFVRLVLCQEPLQQKWYKHYSLIMTRSDIITSGVLIV